MSRYKELESNDDKCKMTDVFCEMFGPRNANWDNDGILQYSQRWIEKIETLEDGMEKELYLGHVYFLKSIYLHFDFEMCEIACEHFGNVLPVMYSFRSDYLAEYILMLKLCYRFETVVELLNTVLENERKLGRFQLTYFCYRELADYSMVADGIITKDEFNAYKKQCLELLEREKQYVQEG